MKIRISVKRHIKNSVGLLVVVGGMAVVGASLLRSSQAATPFITAEVENGTISAPAAQISDAGAAGGRAVVFAAAAAPPTGTSRTLNCAPAAAATMTNAVSHLCGFPDATNTGITAGTVLKRVPQDITSGAGWHYDSRGWIAVDTAGAVFNGIDTSLNVDVTANNVTVQNSRIKSSGENFGISVRHASNVILQNNEISGTDSAGGRLLVTIKDIYGDAANLHVLKNNLYYTSTAIQMDDGLIQDNYIHDMGLIAGDHINGTTSGGGTAPMIVRHNTSFNQFSQTDAISLFEDFGVQTNKTIDNNLVAGGGYCIYAGQNAGGAATSNIKVTSNHFSRLFYPNCGDFGPVTAYSATGSGNVFSGNIWDDTGAAVGL